MCALRSGRREGLGLPVHCSLSLYFKKIPVMVSQALLSTGLYPDSELASISQVNSVRQRRQWQG